MMELTASLFVGFGFFVETKTQTVYSDLPRREGWIGIPLGCQ
jgi:hypothetical protein